MMKSFSELTAAALAAHKNNTPRSEFLATLDPAERSDGAMQFDRAGRLEVETQNPPTEDEIAAEARRIATVSRLASYCEENPSAYGSKLLSYMLAGRMMPQGMANEAAAARAYAANVTAEELAAARKQAEENLGVDRDYLAARLGLAEK